LTGVRRKLVDKVDEARYLAAHFEANEELVIGA
jgi:hypothetical protein